MTTRPELPTTVLAVSRGGEVKSLSVTGLDGKALMCRWTGLGGPCEFSLTSGVIITKPQWAWRWQLHRDDLDKCRESAGLHGALRPPPARRPRVGKKVMEERQNVKQESLFK